MKIENVTFLPQEKYKECINLQELFASHTSPPPPYCWSKINFCIKEPLQRNMPVSQCVCDDTDHLVQWSKNEVVLVCCPHTDTTWKVRGFANAVQIFECVSMFVCFDLGWSGKFLCIIHTYSYTYTTTTNIT